MSINSDDIPLSVLRRSAAEILACTVMRLFPNTLLVSGSDTELGFYYDFVFEHTFSDLDLRMIEEQMRSLIKEDVSIRSPEMMRENAANFFSHKGQEIQSNVVTDVQENIVSIFQINDFYDYCPSPHLATTGEIGAFKLLKTSQMDYLLTEAQEVVVTRITGTAFHDPMALKQHLKRLEFAKKRDHRILGEQMDLYSYCSDGDDDWLWHPKGVVIRNLLIDLYKDQVKSQKFQSIWTPSVMLIDADIAHPASRSTQHGLVFQSRARFEEDLPIRYTEWIQWFNDQEAEDEDEDGLFQSLSCTGDVDSIFCKKEQLQGELNSSLQFIEQIVRMLGFEYHWYLVHCHKEFQSYSNDEKDALGMMKKSLASCGYDFKVDEQEGELNEVLAEVRVSDALGRQWKGPSIKIDFETPKKLGLVYQGNQGWVEPPGMLMMSLIGSLERLIGLLVESTAGALPLWLAPEQIRVISIGMQSVAFAKEVTEKVEKSGFRVGTDYRDDKLGSKIHRAEIEKIPYMLIVGDKEQSRNEITVRSGNQDPLSKTMALDAFLEHVRKNGDLRIGERKTLES